MTTVAISGPLRDFSGSAGELFVSAPTVRAALAEIEREHPRLYHSVCEETGAVRRHINIFVNATNVKDGAGLDTEIGPGDVMVILPAVSGG
jgi:molybdopterin converting factor small subunit